MTYRAVAGGSKGVDGVHEHDGQQRTAAQHGRGCAALHAASKFVVSLSVVVIDDVEGGLHICRTACRTGNLVVLHVSSQSPQQKTPADVERLWYACNTHYSTAPTGAPLPQAPSLGGGDAGAGP
jgi:hypothetical protein